MSDELTPKQRMQRLVCNLQYAADRIEEALNVQDVDPYKAFEAFEEAGLGAGGSLEEDYEALTEDLAVIDYDAETLNLD